MPYARLPTTIAICYHKKYKQLERYLHRIAISKYKMKKFGRYDIF